MQEQIINTNSTLKNTKTYSLMYESPFSQRSTILAFGLHSDITSCKASANFPFWYQCTAKPKNTHTHIYIYRERRGTVNDLGSAFVFGDDLRRSEIQLLLLSFIVRHRLGASDILLRLKLMKLKIYLYTWNQKPGKKKANNRIGPQTKSIKECETQINRRRKSRTYRDKMTATELS
jgi:hypothetical protein